MKTWTRLVKNLSERISTQTQEINELSNLIESKSQTHLESVMNEWKTKYNDHKLQYLMFFCNTNKSSGGESLSHEFSLLFNKKPNEKEKFYFAPEKQDGFVFSRIEQIECFKRSLKNGNSELIKFNYSPEGKSYCFDSKKYVFKDYIEISAYEFVSLEDYIGNCMTQYRKKLSSLKSVQTRLLKEQETRSLETKIAIAS